MEKKREIRNPWLVMALARKKRDLLLSKYEIVRNDTKLDKEEKIRYSSLLKKLKCEK